MAQVTAELVDAIRMSAMLYRLPHRMLSALSGLSERTVKRILARSDDARGVYKRPWPEITDRPSLALTAELREAIAAAVASGRNQQDVANEFGVNRHTVRRIVTGELGTPNRAEDKPRTTGSIIGPDGMHYRDIRSAEVASGMERMELAKALMRRGSGWSYTLAGDDAQPPMLGRAVRLRINLADHRSDEDALLSAIEKAGPRSNRP